MPAAERAERDAVEAPQTITDPLRPRLVRARPGRFLRLRWREDRQTQHVRGAVGHVIGVRPSFVARSRIVPVLAGTFPGRGEC